MDSKALLIALTALCCIAFSAGQTTLPYFNWGNPLLPFVALPALGLGVGLTAGRANRAPGLRPIPPPLRIAPGPFFAPAPFPPMGAYMPPMPPMPPPMPMQRPYGRFPGFGFPGMGPFPIYPRKFNFILLVPRRMRDHSR